MSMDCLKRGVSLTGDTSKAHICLVGHRCGHRPVSDERRVHATASQRCDKNDELHCSSSSNEQDVSISRRRALGALTSTLTLVSMPASAEDRAAGAPFSRAALCRLHHIQVTRLTTMHMPWAKINFGISIQAPWSLRKGLRRE